jgi:Arm DNA-binding domain/Phage integrase, N-terminal SAM-like domain
MPIEKLGKRVVDAIKPQARYVIYYDSELTGFCLKVLPSGAKRWCVEYRPGARSRRIAKRRMMLGSTSALTPDQARAAARQILAKVSLGEDPAAERSHARTMPIFREFAERYLAEEAACKLKPKTTVNYRLYLCKHAIPGIGALKLDELTSSDVARLHRRIGQATPMTANRVVECIGSVFLSSANCLDTRRRARHSATHILTQIRSVGHRIKLPADWLRPWVSS